MPTSPMSERRSKAINSIGWPVPDTQFFVTEGIDGDKVRADALARAKKEEVVIVHYHSSEKTCIRGLSECELYIPDEKSKETES
jgi:hypothetical protein